MQTYHDILEQWLSNTANRVSFKLFLNEISLPIETVIPCFIGSSPSLNQHNEVISYCSDYDSFLFIPVHGSTHIGYELLIQESSIPLMIKCTDINSFSIYTLEGWRDYDFPFSLDTLLNYTVEKLCP